MVGDYGYGYYGHGVECSVDENARVLEVQIANHCGYGLAFRYGCVAYCDYGVLNRDHDDHRYGDRRDLHRPYHADEVSYLRLDFCCMIEYLKEKQKPLLNQ
jgi:hypothetical protein